LVFVSSELLPRNEVGESNFGEANYVIINEGSTSNVVADSLVEHLASNSTDEGSQIHTTSTSTCSPETITILLTNNSYGPTSFVENPNNHVQADHPNRINFVSSVPEYVTKDAFDSKYSRKKKVAEEVSEEADLLVRVYRILKL
jgi:hypothetical protein